MLNMGQLLLATISQTAFKANGTPTLVTHIMVRSVCVTSLTIRSVVKHYSYFVLLLCKASCFELAGTRIIIVVELWAIACHRITLSLQLTSNCTICSSVTTGKESTVVWNVHQKTSRTGGPTRYGWPDPTYLERLKSECAAINVTLP